MRFKYEDLRKVKLSSKKNYLIKRWAYYKSIEEAEKDLHRIYEMMKYRIKTKEKYKDISFFVAVSTTEGKSAKKVKVFTKGRPRYKVYGKKVRPHIHIGCYGEMAPSFAEELSTKLNKKIYTNWEEYKFRDYKGKRLFTIEKLKGEDYGASYIPYVYQQADKMLTGGNIDFNEMKDGFFIIED